MTTWQRAFVIGSAFVMGGGAMALLVTWLAPQWIPPAAAEIVVDVPTRPGQVVRTLVARPQRPIGSVVLMAGGHGNLDLRKDGAIGWGALNQLVRTRLAYRDRGLVTIVPDIAGDFKVGAGARFEYRWSVEHARDISGVLAFAAGLARPVYLVGTSRAALSVVNLAARPDIAPQPDAVVVTSGMLMDNGGPHPSVQRNVEGLDRVRAPLLAVFHRDDACPTTPASSATAFRRLVPKAAAYDVVLLAGGTPTDQEPCEPLSAHGFLGLDGQLVDAVTTWLKKWPAR